MEVDVLVVLVILGRLGSNGAKSAKRKKKTSSREKTHYAFGLPTTAAFSSINAESPYPGIFTMFLSLPARLFPGPRRHESFFGQRHASPDLQGGRHSVLDSSEQEYFPTNPYQ
jgi:hypothetical protein